jgi:hypothetical protein
LQKNAFFTLLMPAFVGVICCVSDEVVRESPVDDELEKPEIPLAGTCRGICGGLSKNGKGRKNPALVTY